MQVETYVPLIAKSISTNNIQRETIQPFPQLVRISIGLALNHCQAVQIDLDFIVASHVIEVKRNVKSLLTQRAKTRLVASCIEYLVTITSPLPEFRIVLA
jgi:hypothetical protein